MEPGVECVDVFEVEIDEMVCCSSRREDESVNVVDGDAMGCGSSRTGVEGLRCCRVGGRNLCGR